MVGRPLPLPGDDLGVTLPTMFPNELDLRRFLGPGVEEAPTCSMMGLLSTLYLSMASRTGVGEHLSHKLLFFSGSLRHIM